MSPREFSALAREVRVTFLSLPDDGVVEKVLFGERAGGGLIDGVAVVTFDLPGEPVNKLSDAVKVEFEALLIRLRDDASIRAAVLISGKADSFIARSIFRLIAMIGG